MQKLQAIDIHDIREPELRNGYDFLMGDGRVLPFANESFDAVVSFDVIEHIGEGELILSELIAYAKREAFSF